MTLFEAVIKIDRGDEPEKRAKDIEDGIRYACELLMDEYNRTADDIETLLDGVNQDVSFKWVMR